MRRNELLPPGSALDDWNLDRRDVQDEIGRIVCAYHIDDVERRVERQGDHERFRRARKSVERSGGPVDELRGSGILIEADDLDPGLTRAERNRAADQSDARDSERAAETH